ncbi:AurF N-oxygenase family protein [Actinomadura scrupuli]|uniref:AurF N-oxygenase family protein n=1 Tax=Actinomadura scrupuli TaxID=559629 RepID=UPI003D9A083C
MPRVGRVEDREIVAERLLRSAARASFDPVTDVDWQAPPEPAMPYMPWERVSLYGTPAWERLGFEQRLELSKHELASQMGVGRWLELCLMQMFMRHVYDLDPRSAHTEFALTEVGDETRHSAMFGRLLEKLDTPGYGMPRLFHNMGRLYKAVGGGPSMWAIFLVGEEVFDRIQREAMNDERVQPLVRSTFRIHVVEEARHVRYARQELMRSMAGLSRSALARHRLVAAAVSTTLVDCMIDQAVYPSVGIPAKVGRKVARANPIHQRTRLWMGEKIMPFLTEVGLVEGPGTHLWRAAGLIR